MTTPFPSPSFSASVAVPWFQAPQKLRIKSAATVNATLMKGAPAMLQGWYLLNKNASARYVKFYDQTGAPTVGTDPVDWTLTLPPGSAVFASYDVGIPYFSGLGFGITANVGDADATAVAADDVHGFLLFS